MLQSNKDMLRAILCNQGMSHYMDVMNGLFIVVIQVHTVFTYVMEIVHWQAVVLMKL